MNIPLKTMTGPGPSNCSERVLKVTILQMLAREKQTKYSWAHSSSFQAQSLPTIGHLHPEFCKVRKLNSKQIANSKTGFSLFVYFPLKSQCILYSSYCLVYLVGMFEVITIPIGHTPEQLVFLVEVVEVSTVQVVQIFESLRIVLWYQGACQTVLLEKWRAMCKRSFCKTDNLNGHIQLECCLTWT